MILSFFKDFEKSPLYNFVQEATLLMARLVCAMGVMQKLANPWLQYD
jgi:hypothetical protein